MKITTTEPVRVTSADVELVLEPGTHTAGTPEERALFALLVEQGLAAIGKPQPKTRPRAKKTKG